MAEPVIDLFQTVDVDHHEREGRSIALCRRDIPVEQCAEGPHVEQPGQLVRPGERGDPEFGLVDILGQQGSDVRNQQEGRKTRHEGGEGLGRDDIDAVVSVSEHGIAGAEQQDFQRGHHPAQGHGAGDDDEQIQVEQRTLGPARVVQHQRDERGHPGRLYGELPACVPAGPRKMPEKEHESGKGHMTATSPSGLSIGRAGMWKYSMTGMSSSQCNSVTLWVHPCSSPD